MTLVTPFRAVTAWLLGSELRDDAPRTQTEPACTKTDASVAVGGRTDNARPSDIEPWRDIATGSGSIRS